jgi:putative MATE family efflux protein
LVGPVLVEQTLALGVGFTDKWLAGNLLVGAEVLAAAGLVTYCVGFLPSLFAIPAVAATALVARAVGGGDPRSAAHAAGASFVVGGLISLAVMAVGAWLGTAGVGHLGLPPGSSALAARYLGIMLPAIPAIMIVHVGVAVLRGAGAMTTGLVSMSVVNAVNVAVSAILTAGLLGCPRMGWDGLAWGTAAGWWCGAVVVLWSLAGRRRAMRPSIGFSVNRAVIRRVMAIGGPAGLDALLNALLQLVFLGIVNRLGDVDAAAHALAITIESLAFLPGSAFQVAAATLCGQFLGAGDLLRARRSVFLAAAACMILMGAVAVLFYFQADRLAGWFVGGEQRQPEIAGRAASLVRIVAFAQPFLAMLMVFSGGLRGAGRTRLTLAVNLVGLVAVRLPLAFWLTSGAMPSPGAWLSGPGLGVVGAWLAMAADLGTRGIGMLTAFSLGVGERWHASGLPRVAR